MDIQEKIKTIPIASGVYLMKDAAGRVIYIGKAVALRKRLQSYFRPTGHAVARTGALVRDIRDIDYIETASEAEALLLEAGLIKKHRPKYNISLRDDKSYPYIEITREAFPRISVVRPGKGNRPQDSSRASYYGPYVNAGLIREALTIIRKIFHFCTCASPHPSCLYSHMGLCEAPSSTRRDYSRNIRNVRLILEGKKDALYRGLKEDMQAMARKHEFEKAARIRDQIRAIGALYSGTKDINYFKEAEQLQRALNLPRLPERVETFDISNIMGNQSVGAMVSFFNGKPDKANYRRFRIRHVRGIDDFRMIAEIVRRRYSRLKNEGLSFPDLIIIDGGKGQLAAAQEALALLDVRIPTIAIAKREEEIFLPGKRYSVRLPPDSLALQMVTRMRDEAHRFAISYHRLLRGKNVFGKN